MKNLRRLRDDETGVASTVGTIMALLVFLTFMSLIVNQYVPVWMKDSEAAHMNGAFGQFGSFKGSVDLQGLAAQMAENAGVHYVPITVFTPVTLGVDGIPIFSSPTIGELNSLPEDSRFTTQFTYDIRGVDTDVDESSSGRIVLDVFNRYYIRQSIIYENGAVIRWQNDGQTVRTDPTFEVIVTNETIDIAWSHIALFGRSSTSGTTTEGIHSKLLGVDRQDYSAVESDFWVNGTTPFGVAWVSFLNRTLRTAFGVDQTKFRNCPAYCFQQSLVAERVQTLSVHTPSYELDAVWKDSKQAYDITMRIRNDPADLSPLVKRISAVRIQHAFVNIAIADKGAEVQI